MNFLRNMLRILLQLAAGFVIVLALLVGVVRLVLPEAATLTDDIKTAVNEATGFTIDFRFISAGVSLHGPELRFIDVDLSWPDGEQIIAAEKLVVSVNVIAAIFEQELLPSRVLVEGSRVDVEITAAGELNLQGRFWRELLPPDQDDQPARIPDMQLQFAGLSFEFRDSTRDVPPVAGFIKSFDADFEGQLIEVTAELLPGEELASQLNVQAEVPLRLLLAGEDVAVDRDWSLDAELDDFRLAAWLQLFDVTDLPVTGSEGSIDISIDMRGLQVEDALLEVDLQNVSLVQPDAKPVVIEGLDGVFFWRQTSSGWVGGGNSVRLSRGDKDWPESNYSLRFIESDADETRLFFASADFLRLDDLMPVVRSLASEQLKDAGINGDFRGDLTAFSGELKLRNNKIEDFSVESGFASLGYIDPGNEIDFSGYSGELEASLDGGDLTLFTREARFGLGNVFRNVLDITSLQGVTVWRRTAEGYRILANDIELETPHGDVAASLEVLTDPEFRLPTVDIRGKASIDDASNVSIYLPKILPEDILDWLDSALIAGQVPEANFELSGPLRAFPFLQDEGNFIVRIDIEDGVLDYAPDWPLVSEIEGELVFKNESLYSTRNELTISGMRLEQTNIRIDNLREGILTANGAGEAPITDVLTFLQNSPVRDALGDVLDDVRAEGRAGAKLAFTLPIRDMDAWQLTADFSTTGATLGLEGLKPRFTEVSGSGSIRNTEVSVASATARLLGEPVAISVRPATSSETDISHRADITGSIPVRSLWQAFELPDEHFFDGITPFSARALFPVLDEETGDATEPFRLEVESRLTGAVSTMPYPLSKEAERAENFLGVWSFPDDGQIDFTGSLDRGFNWNMKLVEGEDGLEIERAIVSTDEPPLTLPEEPGVLITGFIDGIVFDDWVEAYEDDTEEVSDWEQMFSRVELQIAEFYGADFRFVDVGLVARPGATAWDVVVTGPWLEGRLSVPFILTGPESMTMDMERLLLVEPLETEPTDDTVDPRNLPVLEGTAREFALGSQRYGSLEVMLERTERGLRSTKLETNAESFRIEASADWEVIDNAQRTRTHIELYSTDMALTLKDLDYDPYMTAKDGKVIADLLWEGPPGMGMVYESTGTVSMDMRNGVVYEVDPGGGRLLGLLSVAAIPRRLSLDFSEMTEDGLPFDTLSGTFQIDFGNAFTCDLGLEGSITDMGVVGRTGILDEDYDQIAAVRPHVSNLAPVAGAFIAGPAVGVATLLITQIFKKPLSGVGGSYFTITGTWDDPQIESVDREDIDLTAFSACEQQLPEMSPEEIQALQDMLQQREPEKAVLPENLFPSGEPEQPQQDLYDD